MKVFVTGGAGYIGYEIIRYLDKSPEVDEIVVYDNLMANRLGLFMGGTYTFNKLTFIQGDILDDRSMQEAMNGAEMVIHLAGRVTTPFTYEDAHLYDQVNKWGTEQVCQAIEVNKPEKVIYFSSAVIYPDDNQLHDVNSNPLPLSPYAKSKYAGERILSRIESFSELFIFRSGNVFGVNPSMRFDTVINRFAFDSITKNRVMLFGTGEEIRPFVSLSTIVEWVAAVLNGRLKNGVYNLVDFNSSINEVLFHFRNHFKNLEYLAMNQDHRIFSLSVKPSEELTLPNKDVESQIKDYLNNLSAYFTIHSK